MRKNDFRVKGIDQFGRNYPVKVKLKNGNVLFGQIAVEQTSPDGHYSIPVFKVIENLHDWKENKIHFGERKISIDGDEIMRISTYRDY
jgi:hypothetical protein